MAEDVGAEVIAPLSAERLGSIAHIVRERRISLVIVSAGPPASGWLRARPTLASRLLGLRLCASVLVVPAPRDG
jgi:hypothetical protein